MCFRYAFWWLLESIEKSDYRSTEEEKTLRKSRVNFQKAPRVRTVLLLTVACSAGAIPVHLTKVRVARLSSSEDRLDDGLQRWPTRLACMVPSAFHTCNDSDWLDGLLEKWIVPWGCGAHHIARPCHITRCKRLLCQTGQHALYHSRNQTLPRAKNVFFYFCCLALLFRLSAPHLSEIGYQGVKSMRKMTSVRQPTHRLSV
ncbi:hypothetical protein BDW74DRAFT_71649 [Aspergillus multicolor]|uniref:uncharacterized protein n=1 Tax=Aspergillus multicolor TaxID=41759 RepID=UPI003CCE31FC